MAANLPEDYEPPVSMVMTRINGRDYPMRSVPQCYTCQSPRRQWIEEELIAGRSYRAIVHQLEGVPEGRLPHPSAEGLSRHVRDGHLPIPHQQRRGIIEKRARDIGRSIENDEQLVDYVTVNQMIVNRGFERLMNGEIEPDAKDLISAIATLHKIESTTDQGYETEAYQEAMFVYMDVAKKYIPSDVFQQYGRELARNPILRAIAARQAQENTVPGEATSSDE